MDTWQLDSNFNELRKLFQVKLILHPNFETTKPHYTVHGFFQN